jgi:hypothetical protein
LIICYIYILIGYPKDAYPTPGYRNDREKEERARKAGRCQNDDVGRVLRDNEEAGISKRKQRGIFKLLG